MTKDKTADQSASLEEVQAEIARIAVTPADKRSSAENERLQELEVQRQHLTASASKKAK